MAVVGVPVVPPGQRVVKLAHRQNIVARVVQEIGPSIGVRLLARAPQRLVLGQGFAEQQQIGPCVGLRQLFRHAHDLAQLVQRAGQGVGHGSHHGVVHPVNTQVDTPTVGHHGPVEVRLVAYDFKALVAQVGQQRGARPFARDRSVGRHHRQVFDVQRPVAQRPLGHHDLRLLGVGVGAVADRHRAVGLGVEEQRAGAVELHTSCLGGGSPQGGRPPGPKERIGPWGSASPHLLHMAFTSGWRGRMF